MTRRRFSLITPTMFSPATSPSLPSQTLALNLNPYGMTNLSSYGKCQHQPHQHTKGPIQSTMYPARIQNFFFPHPSPNPVMIDVVNSCVCQHHSKSTSYDRDWKCLYLFGRKAYSSAALQFRMANYQDLMAKYNYMKYARFNSFIDHLPEPQLDQFQAIIN